MDSKTFDRQIAVKRGTFNVDISDSYVETGTDTYLNVKDVARFLGIGRSTVFLWAKGGVIPPQRKFGRVSRWSLRELEQWLKGVPRGAYGKGGEN